MRYLNRTRVTVISLKEDFEKEIIDMLANVSAGITEDQVESIAASNDFDILLDTLVKRVGEHLDL